MKKYLLLPLLLVNFIAVSAQDIEAAKKMLYYERFKSAIKLLEPAVKADSKNTEAAYWLAQAYLQMPKSDLAKSQEIITKALEANPGNGLLNAGLGHIYIKQNKPEEARVKLTAAESAAGKNADILLAVARAAIDAKEKNYDYALGVLNKALALKTVNKVVAYTLIGNAYRKMVDGSNAYINYRSALEADPKSVVAQYQVGKMYQTQGSFPEMLETYAKVTAADPAFAPVYLTLYSYYSQKDVNKAKEYLDKYVANTDADCNVELFATDYLFKIGNYSEALAKSAELEKGNCKAEIGLRLKVLNAYCYDRLKDSVNAKKSIEEFMQQEQPNKIQPNDYEIAATVFARFAGSEEKAIEYINKAYENDSAGRVNYLLKIIDLYKKTNNAQQVAATWDRLFTVKAKPSNVDLYNRAMAHMAILNYSFADSLWQQYKEKYPDQIYGYTYRIKCNEALDTSMQLGLAVPHYESMVVFANRDTAKYKSQLISSLYKLVIYYGNISKDKPKAIEYLTQYLLFDPTNEEAKKILEKLKTSGS
jgi:lipopolysaccharide biosynthesis regulator YciM